VTCYPFHFLGSAPQRFVVTAHRTRHAAIGSTETEARSIPQHSSSTQEEL
jgi:sortase (surface protein transpeptidase)